MKKQKITVNINGVEYDFSNRICRDMVAFELCFNAKFDTPIKYKHWLQTVDVDDLRKAGKMSLKYILSRNIEKLKLECPICRYQLMDTDTFQIINQTGGRGFQIVFPQQFMFAWLLSKDYHIYENYYLMLAAIWLKRYEKQPYNKVHLLADARDSFIAYK